MDLKKSLHSQDRQLCLLNCRINDLGIVAGLISIAAPLRLRLKSVESIIIPLYLTELPDEPYCSIELPNIYQGNTNGHLADITLKKICSLPSLTSTSSN